MGAMVRHGVWISLPSRSLSRVGSRRRRNEATDGSRVGKGTDRPSRSG